MKTCSKCRIIKDESEFGKDKNRKDGFRFHCKKCESEYSKIHYKKNKERIDNRNKTYNENNKEKIKEYKKQYSEGHRKRIKNNSKEYRENNKEAIKERDKIYRKNNKEKIKESNRDYYESNKDKKKKNTLQYCTLKLKTDPKYKLKFNIRQLFKSNLRNNFIKKTKSTFGYTGVLYVDYILYFENNFANEFAELTEKNKYHIDHIIPCAVYNFNNPEDIKKCFQPENLRLILAKENLSKGDTLDYDLIEKHTIWHLLPEHLQQGRKQA